ncbi:hypothetical protein [Roseovarius sp. E0-M6]|uniref:hypothetical protein n=1 Tax=Roseovarius sp. E0-M6 TaxID=3127118 RepID=UPI00300FCE01
MKYLRTTALALTMSAMGVTASADTPVISDVEVDADYSAYKRSNVVEVWPSLEEGLGAAISSLVEFGNGEMPVIKVELNKIAIDGDTALPDSGEINLIEGQVVVHASVDATVEKAVDDREPDVIQASPLIVTAMTGDGGAVPEGWVSGPPSEEDFYNALIGAYAVEFVNRLDLD